jgi:hypothetical protein
MPAHLKSFMRNSDVKKKYIYIYIMPFLAFEKRVVTRIYDSTFDLYLTI